MSDTARPGRTTGGSEDARIPGPPPAVRTWASRAALLRDRADAMARLHDADLALGPMLRTGLLVVAAAGALVLAGGATIALSDNERTTPAGASVAAALVCTAIAGALIWEAWRRTVHAREVGLRRRAWEDLSDEPAARALPRGDLAPQLREPFDARQDPDAADYIGRILTRKYVAPWESRLLARAFLSSLFIAPGLGFVLASTASGADGAALMPAGVVLLGAGAIQAAKGTQRAYRATQRWKHARVEYQAWTAEGRGATS